MDSQGGMTIAIPNWNHEMLLPRSIRSALSAVALLRETGVPAEVLVIDDCSRDGSVTLLRQLEALHYEDGLRVLAFAANGGLAASRNAALVHSQYRYITFLDADNELIPENLPSFLRALEDTQAAAAYGNLLVRTPTCTSAVHVISNESVQAKLFHGNYIDAFAMFDRLQVLDVGGYDKSCAPWEDYELWLHLATNGREIVFVPIVMGYYYLLPGSMIQTECKHEALQARVARIYDQLKCRSKLQGNSFHRRYHPELGYI